MNQFFFEKLLLGLTIPFTFILISHEGTIIWIISLLGTIIKDFPYIINIYSYFLLGDDYMNCFIVTVEL